jgi:hypothetical protein
VTVDLPPCGGVTIVDRLGIAVIDQRLSSVS